MAADGRSFRPNPRVDVTAIARAAWRQLTRGHTHYAQASPKTCDAEVDNLVADLAMIVRLAGQLMADASVSLHQADLKSAESVISNADDIEARCEDIDQRCLHLLTLRASVAVELHMVVAAMQVVQDLRRMCSLAQHIAEIALLKHPIEPIPADVAPVSRQMGVLASRLAEDAAAAIESQDSLSAVRLAQVDNEVDGLRRRIFQILFDQNWSHGVETAVDTALIGRYYERFADHAVAVARKITGAKSSPKNDHFKGASRVHALERHYIC
jgi:phosphate transport system protein